MIPILLKTNSFEDTEKYIGDMFLSSTFSQRSLFLSSVPFLSNLAVEVKWNKQSVDNLLNFLVLNDSFVGNDLDSVLNFSNVLNNPFTDDFFKDKDGNFNLNLRKIIPSKESWEYMNFIITSVIVKSPLSESVLTKEEKINFIESGFKNSLFKDLQDYCDVKNHLKMSEGNKLSLISTKELMFFLKYAYLYDVMSDSLINREILRDFFNHANESRKSELSQMLPDVRYSGRISWILDVLFELEAESPGKVSNLLDGFYKCLTQYINFNLSLRNGNSEDLLLLHNHIEALDSSLEKFSSLVQDRDLASMIAFVYGVCPHDDEVGKGLLRKIASIDRELFVSVTSQLELHQSL